MAIYARKVSIMLVQKFDNTSVPSKWEFVDVKGTKLVVYWKATVKEVGGAGKTKLVAFQVSNASDGKNGVSLSLFRNFVKARIDLGGGVKALGEMSSLNVSIDGSLGDELVNVDQVKVRFGEVWMEEKKEGGGSGKVSDSDYVLSIADKLETEKNLLKLKVYESELATRMAAVIEKGKLAIEGSDDKKAFTATYKTLKLCLTQVEGKIKELSIDDDDDGNLPF